MEKKATEISGLEERLATDSALQFGIIAITLLLYILTKSSLFGVLVMLEIVGIVALEIRHGVKAHGWKHEFKEIAISLIVIVAIWVAAMFVMNTSVPLNAVVSCSMLPNIERGDLVLVQGSEPRAYEIFLTPEEFSQLNSSPVVHSSDGDNVTLKGSLYTYCAQYPADITCREFFSNPSQFYETRGPFSFYYDSCLRNSRKGDYSITTPCLSHVRVKGVDYAPNIAHDTIVYGPAQGDLYSLAGDIIHRLYFKIKVGDSTYYLTKGDNNPVMDIQEYSYSREMGNSPPGNSQYKGKVVGRIPFIGYLKLFISGFFSETTNCDSTLEMPALHIYP